MSPPGRKYLFDRSGLLVIDRGGDEPPSVNVRVIRYDGAVGLQLEYVRELHQALSAWLAVHDQEEAT